MGQAQGDDIQTTLGLSAAGRRRARRGRWITIAATVVIAAGVAWSWRGSRADSGPRYQTASVERQTLTVTVTATGELNALTQVNIGTEIVAENTTPGLRVTITLPTDAGT